MERGERGGTFTLHPRGGARIGVSAGTDTGAAATVTSGDHDFVVWGTKRRPWSSLVTIDGDDAYAAKVLEAVKII